MVASRGLAQRFDFSKTENQSFTVHSIRFGFLLVVLIFTLSFQFFESRIDATQVFYPLYFLIGFSLLLQFSFFLFFRNLHNNPWTTGFLFFFEAFYITGLIYFIGVQQSLLIFLYLVNLILCGVIFQRKGALMLALWTSVLFSFIVSLDTSLSGNTAYLAVGVNNLAFFTVAYLAGYLSEQLNVMGAELKERVRDVVTLKNLNELILSNINSGLITVDQQMRILQANPAAHSILGLKPGEVLNKPFSACLPQLELATASLEQEFDIKFDRQGEKRILSLSVSELRDESGLPQGRIVAFQDHTHMKALEKRVRQSEKMAAIGQLAAGIAHEIRNPLAGISGSIELLKAGDSDVAQTTKLMSIVSKEIDRLNNLITEFLDFAKPEAPMEDKIDLGKLIGEVVQFMQNDVQTANLKVDASIQGEFKILGNRDKLKQALLNILVNAAQAMEEGEQPVIAIDVRKNGKWITVSIKDNGVGMSDELKERIFEPFHTTKHKGTGLGLAITHSIIEAHKGDIQVNSELGVGTEFLMNFTALNPS